VLEGRGDATTAGPPVQGTAVRSQHIAKGEILAIHDIAAVPIRLRLRGRINDTTEKLALRAAFAAAHLFGLATGILLRRLRGMKDPLAQALAQAREAETKAVLLAKAVEILGSRFDKLPERRSPFYTPRQRFQILELKSLVGWSGDEIARLERFWRTLKETASLKTDRPLTVRNLERRSKRLVPTICAVVPIRDSRGATPAEAFLGIEPACQSAISPPRGRRGEGPTNPPFAIDFLDPDRRALPILKKTA
jgi:hypothetical protein